MRGVVRLTILFLFISTQVWGQTSLSFYHLGSATFQNSSYNPVYIPNGKFMLGLPVLSGIHLHYNNKHNYQEIFKVTEAGNPKVDLGKIYRNMGVSNMVSTQLNVSLIHMAVRLENGSAASLFVNERIESDFLYSKAALELVNNDNSIRFNKQINVGRIRTVNSHFREMGIGYTLYNEDLKLTAGMRLKYLQGFFNVSTPGIQKATIETDADTYVLKGKISNTTLRTSGLDIAQGNEGSLGSHLIFNGNAGAAIDLGFHWDMNKYYAVSVSLTDLGYISWKEDTQNYTLNDTTFTYSGFNLKEPGSIKSTVEDSLLNKFKIRENTDSYTTLVSPKIYGSWFYHINPNGDVITSMGARYVQGYVKTMFGLGYQHRLGSFLTGSVSLTKLPQQFFNVGASFAVKGGPVQLYVAADQIATWDLTHFQSFDVRFGINFIFNSKKEKGLKGSNANGSSSHFEKQKVEGPKYSQNQSFMGQKVKVKRHEGIYSIIPLQKRRVIDEELLTPEDR